MASDPKPASPLSLPMPLRDVLRGVGAAVDVTEDMLEPAAALLPAPLRKYFSSALRAVEDAGDRAVRVGLAPADVTAAAEYLRGTQADPAALVRVLADTWQSAHDAHTAPHLLFSETVAARSLHGAEPPNLTGFDRAAALLLQLRNARVIGQFPGTPITISKDAERVADLTLVSAFVWLLTERSEDPADEPRLLQLAVALTRTLQDDVLASLGDPVTLSAQLERLSDHL